MTVVLTICSANYLAHAKVLGDSLAVSNPEYKFVIGLVDRVPTEINLASWLPYEVILVTDLRIPEFPAMAEKYGIVELNTAVKPFYLEFLYQRDPSVEIVIYLDPDILVLGSFRPLAEKMEKRNIALTPHSCTHDDSLANIHYEIGMLCTGIYNLGFILTVRAETTFAFLKWWQRRLLDYCYYRAGAGLFVDQLWVSLAPLYFEGVYVETNPGYNMCYWNHFERQLSCQANRYLVNGRHDLVFYHFSNYNPLKPDAINSRPTEPTATFAESPELRPLYDDYRRRLMEAGYASVSMLQCSFGKKPKPKGIWKRTTQKAITSTLSLMPGGMWLVLKQATTFIARNC